MSDSIPAGLDGVVYPFFARHVASDEVGNTDDFRPSAVQAVALSALSTVVHAHQAHPLSLGTWQLMFDDSDDASDDGEEDVH